MKAGLYPKIAADGIRKNGRLYIPYFITCILMVALFYIMHMLGFSDLLQNFEGASTARDMLRLGTIIMAVFGTIFLFYTQSALVKGRLREFGLYSVLGMNRRNLGRIIFFETLISWLIAMTGGLIAGIGLSKLAELGFSRLIAVEVSYKFNMSVSSLVTTVIVYSVVFFLIFLNAVRRVRFASTINLIRADKAGEKPPKANWVVGILGFVILACGYYIAIKIKQPLSALVWFFIAVILTIVGTYLVLIAGSVLLCRILQKNKKYYYKTTHFVSVSSMAYRMKRNGASLASICILLTMILVMISSTSALYINREETLMNHYPRHINAFASKYGYEKDYLEIAGKLKRGIDERTKEYGAAAKNEMYFCNYCLSGYFENSCLDLDINPMDNFTTIDYDKVAQVYFFDVDTYNRLTGENESLSEGKVIAVVDGKLEVGDELKIGKETFDVVKRTDNSKAKLRNAVSTNVVSTIYVIVDDVDKVASLYKDYKDPTGSPMLSWYWIYDFDTDLDAEHQTELGNMLNKFMHDELTSKRFVNYCDSRENQRNDFIKTFGGLFFLGILLSIIFLVSCVLIIYYKQISEGFEDQSRFGIMQKVGMTKENIKKSINSQMLTVFLVPIAFACLHLAVVLPIIHKLLLLFGHNNMPLLLSCAGVCVLICGVFYAVIYKLTSNAYYKIVS
ncbi:MAG: ABC transporter permease [Ruminococcaceae bacterium]|nr:ABC transporter permease [Oscillospiraceae bacterium]